MKNPPKTLEEEIQDSVQRINGKTSEYDDKIIVLEKNIQRYTWWSWFFIIVGGVIALAGFVLYLLDQKEIYHINLLGDFYGGAVASLWSLAGLFLIYVAFLGQKHQLLNQQLELMYSQLEVKYTRLELEGQKKEMIEQNKTLRQQRFENTFFQLLRNHQDIVSSIDIRKSEGGNVLSQGRDCFRTFYREFRDRFKGNALFRKNTETNSTISEYEIFYKNHQSDLGHYFRHLYHILKFVNNSIEIEEENKFIYTSLLRALLSSNELALLFYHGLSKNGSSHLKPLIEKFSFLKNLDDSMLVNKVHKEKYDTLAFAASNERQMILKERSSIAMEGL